MSDTDSTTQKKALRKEITGMLRKINTEDRHDRSTIVCRRLTGLDAFRHASTVMLYMPLPTEVDVTAIALSCFQQGKTVCVPKVDWDRKDMCAVEVLRFDDSEMDIDEHGIRVPRDIRLTLPEMIDLVVVPGLAFDTKGNRLGRGGGFYDRYLGKLGKHTTKIAVAFDEQIVESVPTERGDLKVDQVVTDRRAIGIGRAKTS